MTSEPREPSGDYGYDLVHEDVGQRTAAAEPSAPQAGAPWPSGPPSGAEGARADDLGYDEAHGF